MAKLLYSMIASLDGYVADERGEFGWAEPGEEVHRFAAGVVYLRYGVTPPAT